MSVRVQREDFDVGVEIARITSGRTDVGAVVTFSGVCRGDKSESGEPIATMTLEHYPGMTEAELERVDAEARERWPLQASLIVHRFGEMRPGDNIVLVVTASALEHWLFSSHDADKRKRAAALERFGGDVLAVLRHLAEGGKG